MESTKPKRKRRSDRRHIIYVLTNTVTGEEYVGLTVCIDRSGKKSLAYRWARHVGRATNQKFDWTLCNSIRKHGRAAFEPRILEFVRGKAAAHARETELRHSGAFALNTA